MMMRVLPILAGAVMLVSGCGKGSHEGAAPGAPPVAIQGVTVEQVQTAEIAERQEVTGTVRAVTSVVLAARIAGTLSEMKVNEGDRVTKGQVIAVIEANETLAGAAAAAAGVEEATRALDESKSRKKLADATLQRYQKLFAEQAVTKQEFENRQMEQEVAAQGVLRAESRLVMARESAKGAAVMSGHTRLVSPITGIVTARSADRGATLFPGTPVLSIEEESGYRLEVQAPETLKGSIAAGQKVEIALEGLKPQTAAIAEVVPVVDPASRTFTVKISVSAKGVRSGAYGRAWFPLGTVKGIMLPKAALLERSTLTSVWVVDSGNIARMRLVKPGKVVGDRVEILSGLSQGEKVAVAGIDKITDGVKVE